MTTASVLDQTHLQDRKQVAFPDRLFITNYEAYNLGIHLLSYPVYSDISSLSLPCSFTYLVNHQKHQLQLTLNKVNKGTRYVPKGNDVRISVVGKIPRPTKNAEA